MTAETKQFHIGDILSITAGRLVSLSRMDGVYDILNWLTDDNLYTHQLPRASEECAPFLRETFPDLAAVEIPVSIDSMETLAGWLASLGPEYGTHRDVPRAPAADHARIDPLLELNHMVGADRVIPVVVSGEAPGVSR